MSVICQTCRYYTRPKPWKKRNKDTGFCNRNENYGLVHKAGFCQWWTLKEKKK